MMPVSPNLSEAMAHDVIVSYRAVFSAEDSPKAFATKSWLDYQKPQDGVSEKDLFKTEITDIDIQCVVGELIIVIMWIIRFVFEYIAKSSATEGRNQTKPLPLTALPRKMQIRVVKQQFRGQLLLALSAKP